MTSSAYCIAPSMVQSYQPVEVPPRVGDVMYGRINTLGAHRELENKNGCIHRLTHSTAAMFVYGNRYATDAFEAATRRAVRTTIRCLFLAPGGVSIAARELEEDYPPGHLSTLTEMNIRILSERVRNRLAGDLRERVQIATYDETIRLNISLVDDKVAVVQPYLPLRRSIESPTLVIRRQSGSPGLYPLFRTTFEWLWEGRTDL